MNRWDLYNIWMKFCGVGENKGGDLICIKYGRKGLLSEDGS